MRIRDELPSVYARLLPSFFDAPSIEEPKATCGDCAMCEGPGREVAGTEAFSPSTKCCTFTPRLPSYLVGAILADEAPEMAEGRARVRARIASRVVVTPRWLSPSAKRNVLLNASRRSSFGRSTALLCPFFREGEHGCTIWRHRESVCSTFFCKYGAGADGLAYWRALEAYVANLEIALTRWAVAQVAPELEEPPRKAEVLSRWELEDRPPPDDEYARWWGRFLGREEELYRACFERVRDMDLDLARALVSEGGHAARLGALEAAHARVRQPVVPLRLRKSDELTARPLEGGGKVVVSYWPYDPHAMPDALFELLDEFSAGETTDEVRARLARDAGVEIPEELVRELYRVRLLVEA